MSDARAPSPPHAVDGELRNPDVRHERTDVDTRAVLSFVVALAAGIGVAMGVLWGVFWLFFGVEASQKRSSYPLLVEQRERETPAQRLPPSPRLEGVGGTGPEHSVGRNKPGAAVVQAQAEAVALSSYAWRDGEKAARIPIRDAMTRLAGKLPARQDARPAREFFEEPSRSSSGRRSRGGEE